MTVLPLHAGILKYWVSGGRGSLGLSTSDCVEQTFYCLATTENTEPVERTEGLTACVSPIAPKPFPFGTIKSTNYLQNVLAKLHAEEQEFGTVSFRFAEGGHFMGSAARVRCVNRYETLVCCHVFLTHVAYIPPITCD